MSVATRYNKTGRLYNYTMPENTEYKNLKDLYADNGENAIYPVYGFYINTKGKYGDNPVAYSKDFYINLPEHMTDTIREIMADAEATEQINGGGLGCSIYSYEKEMQSKGRRWTETFYSINFVDL